jgi:hypothetical protein
MTVTTAATLSARGHYGWLLLSGWFILLATLLSYAIAGEPQPGAAHEIGIAFAMLAFLGYFIATKRQWSALGVLVIAGMLTAVWSGWFM